MQKATKQNKEKVISSTVLTQDPIPHGYSFRHRPFNWASNASKAVNPFSCLSTRCWAAADALQIPDAFASPFPGAIASPFPGVITFLFPVADAMFVAGGDFILQEFPLLLYERFHNVSFGYYLDVLPFFGTRPVKRPLVATSPRESSNG